MNQQPTLDPQFAALLDHLHRGGGAGHFWCKGQGSTWWNGDGPPALPARTNLYFGVHPAVAMGQRNQRSTLATVAALNCLFAEFDVKDFADWAGLNAHVERLDPAPSAIVGSGGGYHAYWLLDRPFLIDSDAARERARELQARWVAFVGGDPGAKDLARVLRVPGTLNGKYDPPRPVELLRCDLSTVYDLGELAAALPPVAAPEPAAAPPRGAPGASGATRADERRRRYGEKALADEIARMALAQNGTRNNQLNISAYTLGRLVASGCLDEDTVEHELASAALAAGLTVRETLDTLRSGLQAGIAEGPRATLPDFDAPPEPRQDATAAAAPPAGELPRAFVLQCLREEESGDAQLLAHLYRGRLVFDRAASTWYAFEGHAWKPTGGPPRGAVRGRVAAAYLALAAELQGEGEGAGEGERKRLAGQVEQLYKRARALGGLHRCNNVLTFAGDMDMLGILGEEWDRDPWLLGVANGVVDLRTGEHRAGAPADFIRTAAPTPWEGLHTPAPRWERFVSEVMSGESDRVGFLHHALGYALNGTTREHILVLLIGERGRNGKGVLFETLGRVLGGYAGAVSSDVIIGQQHRRVAGSAQPHLMELRGKRLAYTSETADGDQMGAAQVKLITGGDTIIARDLYEKAVAFSPSHTLFVATNRRPHAPADDDALWERVKVLEFKARFVEDPSAPDEQRRDAKLGEALLAEAPGILAWLVRGHLAYLRDGLRTPESVKLARDAYRRGESIEPFIAARCVEWDGGQEEASALLDAYKAWCEREGLQPKTPHWFGRQLAARYEKGRTPGVGRVCYFGVSLASEGDPPEKPSGGVTTRNSGDERGAATRFCEGFEPISESFSSDLPHEGKFAKTPSKVHKVHAAPDVTADVPDFADRVTASEGVTTPTSAAPGAQQLAAELHGLVERVRGAPQRKALADRYEQLTGQIPPTLTIEELAASVARLEAWHERQAGQEAPAGSEKLHEADEGAPGRDKTLQEEC